MFKQYIIQMGINALVSILTADTSTMKPKKAKIVKDIKKALTSEEMQNTMQQVYSSYMAVIDEIEDGE